MYRQLEDKTRKAMSDLENLSGVKKTAIYYIYGEILECIQKNLFHQNFITAQIELFKIEIIGNNLYINTEHPHSQKMKAFKMNKDEIKSIVLEIKGAIELVGLKPIGGEKNFDICISRDNKREH